MAYIPLADVAGGFSSGFSGASRDIMAIQQARQLAEQRKQQMALDQAEEQRRQAEEAAKAAQRPLDLAASQYALRGSILGTAKTPEDYATALGEVNRLGLPASDLPIASSGESTAWKTFTQKPAPVVVPWLPEKWRPAPILPAPEAQLPTEDQRIGATDMSQVQAAAERGLPLDKQQKFRDQDIGRQIQLDNLARNREKDALSAKWAAIREEGTRLGWDQKRQEFEFDKYMQSAKLDIDRKKVEDSGMRGEVIKASIKDLSTLSDEARTANAGIKTLDQMQSLLASGAGSRPGQIKVFLSRLTGQQTAQMADAEVYQLLAETLRGPLRADIVGPGPMTESEQRLLGQVTGGGATGQKAAARLLAIYKDAAKAKIATYNSKRRSVSEFEPSVLDLYEEIGGGSAAKPAAPPSAPARSARNQQEFNTIWATLKPGETLQDPTGKTWKKGSAR